MRQKQRYPYRVSMCCRPARFDELEKNMYPLRFIRSTALSTTTTSYWRSNNHYGRRHGFSLLSRCALGRMPSIISAAQGQ